MGRLKIAIVFGQKPNYNTDAFKYFLLSINKVQQTYEFLFPDLESCVFPEQVCSYDSTNKIFQEYIQTNSIIADHCICIITHSFDNNFFFNSETDTSVITTDIWDKYFSPPSLFEYLMHSIFCCLIYSQKTTTVQSVEALQTYIDSHTDTRGCIADFTRTKADDRIDIALGYICEQHQNEIKTVFGEQYLKETQLVLERKWIGNQEEKGSVAYNLKHIFKFDINKDSGFNKTLLDKVTEKFYEIPGEMTKEVVKTILIIVLTYFLVVKFGIKQG